MNVINTTPLPWHHDTDENYIRDEAGVIVAACYDLKSDPTGEIAEANAALIVRAVNNHAALVEALESCRDALIAYHDGHAPSWAEDAIRNGHAALAAARE